MDVGMLWFDSNHQQDVSARIEKASMYYRSKYGRKPDICYVHPSTMSEPMPNEVDGMKVMMSQTILPNHFWLGIEKMEALDVHSKVAA